MRKKWIYTTTPILGQLVFHHSSNDSDLVTVYAHWKCVLVIEDKIEVYGMKAVVNSSLWVSVFF